jgi:bifunctional ADP-heptose synthase (sugar kinase/adenylyltransferase)
MITQLVDDFIEKAKPLKVAVIGETIVDEFVYVSYEGQSMKSICPAFKLSGRKEIQQGGTSAIALHLKDFVKSVDIFTNTNSEIVKTRYVDINDQKKHVEINKFDTAGFGPIKVNASDYDVVIVADFGHGFCDKLDIGDGFHLMCQTNSNNFGFNRVSKWKKHRNKSVCIDLREASLQMNRKINFSNEQEILDLYNYELNTEQLFLTLGSKGSVQTDGKKVISFPSFKSEIVDTIGAGDTFYAFASLTAHLYGSHEQALAVPSLAASLSTTWLCNEQSVTREKLKNYATRSL